MCFNLIIFAHLLSIALSEGDYFGCCCVGHVNIRKAVFLFCVKKAVFDLLQDGHSERLSILTFSSIKELENSSLTYYKLS